MTILMGIAANSANASVSYCPQKLAHIDGDILSINVSKMIQRIYRRLGCTPQIEGLPGRRGIHAFNDGAIDGEIYRHPIIEPIYTRTFVRSTVPLFHLSNALWVFDQTPEDKPVGYLIGVLWHENFVEQRRNDYRFRKFSDSDAFVEAAVSGEIRGFLSQQQSIDLLLEHDRLPYAPRLEEMISKEPLFHYLDSRFSDFMKDFSEILLKEQSFGRFK